MKTRGMDCILPKRISPVQLLEWLHGDEPHPILIDVREDQEIALASLPFEVLHCPLSRPQEWIEKIPNILSDQLSVVVFCHAGIRSWNFGIWLIEQNLAIDVRNLEGGIDSWSLQIDPSIPRY